MPPKSKTQKRNEQKRKQNKSHNVGGGEAHHNKQQEELHRLAKENKDLAKKQAMFDAAQRQFRDVMRSTPGTAMYDPNFKPSPASAPSLSTMVDEKYVKVPDVAQVALDQAIETLKPFFHIGDGKMIGIDKQKAEKVSEALKTAKELLAKPQPTLVRKITLHIAHYHALCDAMAHVKDDRHRAFMKSMIVDNPTIPTADMDLLKGIMRAGLKKDKHNEGYSMPMRVGLAHHPADQTSGANAINSYVQRIRPGDSAEFTSLSALFDEYKNVSAETHFFVGRSAISTNVFGACGYDPMISTAYGSVEGVVVAQQYVGPFAINEAGIAPTSSVAKSGLWSLHAKMPEGSQYEYGAVTGIATGVWTDSNTTAVDYGYFKFCILAAGASNTTFISQIVKMHCLWRCRS
jgi:hypothetical protein